MKVFVINLERDKERMQALDRRLKELGVEYERISGVYGKTLLPSERRSAVSWIRYLLAYGYLPRIGEIGCQLSHQKVYRKLVEEKIDLACILEDDVKLDDRFPQVLHEVARQYDKREPQLVLLSNHSKRTGFGNDHEGYLTPRDCCPASDRVVIESTKWDVCAEGYVLSAQVAANLLRQNCPMIVPADHWGRWAKTGAIKIYHAFPTVCSQSKYEFVSGTAQGKIFDVSQLNVILRFLWKAWRCIGHSVDFILRAITGR